MNPIKSVLFFLTSLALIIGSSINEAVNAATLHGGTNNNIRVEPTEGKTFFQQIGQPPFYIKGLVTGEVTFKLTFDKNDPIGYYIVKIDDLFDHGNDSKFYYDNYDLVFSRESLDTVSASQTLKLVAPSILPLYALFDTPPEVGSEVSFTSIYSITATLATDPSQMVTVIKESTFNVKRVVPEPLTSLSSFTILGIGVGFKEYSKRLKKSSRKLT